MDDNSIPKRKSSFKKPETPLIDPPGHNGSPSERLLGRTGTPMDFNSTNYSWEGLEEICLENIVVASLNQDILKKNFEIIINALKRHSVSIGKLGKQNSGWEELINDLREKNDKNEIDIKDLQDKNKDFMKDINFLKDNEFKLLDEIEKLKKKDSDQQIEIDELKERIIDIEDKLGKSESRMQFLETKSNEHEDRINDLQSRMNDIEFQLKEMNNLINMLKINFDGLDSKLKLMESLQGNGEGSSADLSAFINELTEIKNRFKNYASRDDFNSVKEDVDYLLKEIKKMNDKLESLNRDFNYLKNDELPIKFSDINTEIKSIYDLLRNLPKSSSSSDNNNTLNSNQYDELLALINSLNEKISNKVNCEDFDREIAVLHERINNLGNKKEGGTPKNIAPVITSSKDANLIKELTLKVADLEGLIRKIQRDLLDQISNYNNFTKETGNKFKNLDEKKMDKADLNIEDLNKRLASIEGDIKNMKDKLFVNEKIISNHDIAINDILKELAKMRKRRSSGNTNNGINQEQINSLLDDLIGKLRKELMALIDDLKSKLSEKVEFKHLHESETNILKKLDEIMGILIKKFCDKNETKRALIYIENRLNQLFASVFGDGSEKDKDALFAKKPLFWSCASCDKDLDKFQGKLGDYRNWGQFPPKNTSPERMGRFGVGYSRMLDDRRSQLAKEREKIKSQMGSTQKGGGSQYDNFPDVNLKEVKVIMKPKTAVNGAK